MAQPTRADLAIVVSDTIDDATTTAVGGGLARHNAEMAGYVDSRPLAVTVRHPATGAILGGATGRTSFGLLFIDLFHIEKTLRGGGIGSAVLAACEAEG